MATFVYLLCALTSTACAFVLLRNYRRSGVRLLLWGGLCFCCFGAGNVVLFIDLGLRPQSIDLSDYRDGLTFLGLVFFSYGLIWEAK